jgi:hypothetical protein
MYLKVGVAVLAFAFAFAVPALAGTQGASSHQNVVTDSGVVECRVLEAHASTAPAALVVIFHQQQKQDQPRLAALIKENSGSAVDIQIRDSAWTRVTIFRLRTSFGRGMFVLPPDSGNLKDGDTFRIRFSKAAPK